ncbi:DUF2189 domain-containing protein [Caulobacter sp. 17J80-11]|uniref:DUF2189 domain-containing protein n=1 Tax=Caulobacter sp. 17J80-11 TaxID=2763502 RepID=UPI001653A827|nr:DUF2189 domain-containing protein [Caulobacter sp. 17J80-11]MBC6981774.1 DUF2189 domain-containing protein [Caulobacter sp. 17J80-11]
MTHGLTSADFEAHWPRPEVRRISVKDLRAVLAAGWRDFKAAPTQLLLLGAIYAVIGLIAARVAFGAKLLPMLYPLVAGLGLVGPFLTVGFCELSRRREHGLPVSWRNVFDVFGSSQVGAICGLGAVLLGIFVLWVGAAASVYAATFGPAPVTHMDFLGRLFTTPEGWRLVVLGNAVGLLFAVVALSLTVVAFPVLIDRHVGPFVAVETSLRVMRANPGPMAVWGLIILAALALGSLPLFVGLAVVVPVLGHATWHLYRRTVVWEDARL